MRYGLKKRAIDSILEPENEKELVTSSTLEPELSRWVAYLRAQCKTSTLTKRVCETYLESLLLSARAAGGRAIEQVISIINPRHFEVLYTPHLLPREKGEEEKEKEGEEGKKRFKLF